MNKKLCTMNIHYRYFSLEYFFESARNNGLNNVEIWLCPQHYFINYLEYEEVNKLLDLKKKYGVNIACLCCEQNNPKPSNMAARDHSLIKKSMKYFKNVIDVASIIGCEKVLMTSGWAYYDESINDSWQRSVEHMKAMVEYAKQRSVKVCIEPLQKYESLLVNNLNSMKDYLADVDSSNLYVALDTGALGGARESIGEWFDQFGEKIIHCHYVDGTPTGHLPIGMGDRNVKSDIKDFLKYGYTGLLSFEFANAVAFEDPRKMDKLAIECIEKNYKEIGGIE